MSTPTTETNKLSDAALRTLGAAIRDRQERWQKVVLSQKELEQVGALVEDVIRLRAAIRSWCEAKRIYDAGHDATVGEALQQSARLASCDDELFRLDDLQPR